VQAASNEARTIAHRLKQTQPSSPQPISNGVKQLEAELEGVEECAGKASNDTGLNVEELAGTLLQCKETLKAVEEWLSLNPALAKSQSQERNVDGTPPSTQKITGLSTQLQSNADELKKQKRQLRFRSTDSTDDVAPTNDPVTSPLKGLQEKQKLLTVANKHLPDTRKDILETLTGPGTSLRPYSQLQDPDGLKRLRRARSRTSWAAAADIPSTGENISAKQKDFSLFLPSSQQHPLFKQNDITTKQNDVTTKQNEITTKQNSVATKQNDINTEQKEVSTTTAATKTPVSSPYLQRLLQKHEHAQPKSKSLSDSTRTYSPSYPSPFATPSLAPSKPVHEKFFPLDLPPLVVWPLQADDRGMLGWKKSARAMMQSRQSLLIHYSKRGMIGDIAQLLVDKPMNVDTVTGSHGTVLQSAVAYGQRDVVSVLLSHGADINAQFANRPGPATSIPFYCSNALTIAIAKNDNEILKFLVRNGADVNAQIPGIDTALKLAVLMGNLSIARTLHELGANIHDVGVIRGDSLQAAAFIGNVEILQYFLDSGADVNRQQKDCKLGSALQAASCRGHFAVVDLLIRRGATFDYPCGSWFGSALHAAAFAGSAAIVKMLVVELKADVNVFGGMFGTALHAAARQGHHQVVKVLAESGANVNSGIKFEKESFLFGKPLHVAAFWGADDVVRELMDRGADINALIPETTLSALSYAIIQNHPRAVFNLVNGGAVLEPEGEVIRPLLTTCNEGRVEMSSFLISRGARPQHEDILAATKTGSLAIAEILLSSCPALGKDSSLLHLALSNERKDLAELFLKHGADINSVTDDVTPLQRTTRMKNAELIELLLSLGADPTCPKWSHSPPLIDAIQQSDSNVVQILLKAGADPNQPETQSARSFTLTAVSARVQQSSVGSSTSQWLPKTTKANITAFNKSLPDIIQSPLRVAVETGNTAIIDILLQHGADANDLRPEREQNSTVVSTILSRPIPSLLSLAIDKGDAAVLDHLLHGGADIQPDLLPQAIAKSRLDMARSLLCAGAISKTSTDVLLGAIQTKNLKLVEILVEHGAAIEPQHTSAANLDPQMLSRLRSRTNPNAEMLI
jgi:ankyrin repeat protein